MNDFKRRTVSHGFTMLELVIVLSLASVLLSLSVPSLVNYRRTNDAILLSDHIMTEFRNMYSISRRFSAFCTVFFTVSSRWSTLSSPTLDLVSTEKKSSGRSTSSPLIARCAEDPNDTVSGTNLVYNQNIINSLPRHIFVSSNKSSFGFTPRGLSNGSQDSLFLIGQRTSSTSHSASCIKVSSLTGKVTSGTYHSSIPSSIRALSHSLYPSLRPDECY